jgi:hypothetical protein
MSSEGSVQVYKYMSCLASWGDGLLHGSTVFQFIYMGCVCFSWWKLEGGKGILEGG